MINPKLAQDVWKDIGEHVQFTVLKLKRKQPEQERAVIRDFADRSQAIIRSLRIRDSNLSGDSRLKVAIGFSYDAWTYLFPQAPVPKELEPFATLKNGRYSMPGTGGDIFFHIRASNEAVVYETQTQFRRFLAPITDVLDDTKGFRYFEGRAIIGFIDGTEAPSPESASDYALIGDEDADFINGSYAFAQKWQHDMSFWNHLTTEKQERAVGREKFTDLELDDDQKLPNAHNVASKIEIDGVEQKIVRMNVPFSQAARGITGTYFIGYARHWQVTKMMLEQMLNQADFLLQFSEILTGQLFFIPSLTTLNELAEDNLTTDSRSSL